MRKQFDIKYRPQIESGEYKVELRDGRPAKIIYWDAKGPSPIVCLYMTDDGSETTAEVRPDGRWSDDPNCEMYNDLFIVTPEEELTEFEKKLSDVVGYAISLSVAEPQKPTSEFVKEYAAELLALARDQFIKDGYVIEKKAFHDAAEKVATEVIKEVSENVDTEEALRLGYEKGRADALKDLPRWKKCEHEMHTLTHLLIRSIDAMWIGASVKVGQYYIPTNDLILKLPGLNE